MKDGPGQSNQVIRWNNLNIQWQTDFTGRPLVISQQIFILFTPKIPPMFYKHMQAVNLRGFLASVNPRFEARIPDFMNKFNTF